MEKSFLRSEYVLFHKAGSMSFPTIEKLEEYVSALRELNPSLDVQSLKVFQVDIYKTDKTFQ